MVKYNIESENSSDHWQFLQVRDNNVLDLGCGRWSNRDGTWDNLNPEEFSPIFINKQGAKHVVGVDASINEISYMNELVKPIAEKFTFIHDVIQTPEQIKNYIKQYEINAIKCDIEGYETNFFALDKEDFNNINSFAVEYHSQDIKNSFLQKLIEDWEFNIVAIGYLWVENMGVIFAQK